MVLWNEVGIGFRLRWGGVDHANESPQKANIKMYEHVCASSVARPGTRFYLCKDFQ